MKRKKKLFQIAIVFLLIVIAVNSFFVIKGIMEYRKGNSTYDEIKETVIAVDPVSNQYGIDFKKLKEINPDIVGWISLDGTVIDYPVVKGEDNDYYLHHLYTGEYNNLGTLFLDFRNKDPFEDRLTTIYGHSMLNGSMFFILERYKRQDFYEQHKQFLFQTENKNYILKPFAGKIVDAKKPFLRLDFENDDDFAEYIRTFVENSTFKADFNVSSADKIVMMIKCSDDFEDARYVLLCKVFDE